MKKRLVCMLLGLSLAVSLVGCSANTETAQNPEEAVGAVEEEENVSRIALSDEEITLDGESVTTDSSNAVYVAKDIVFYLEGQDFTYGEGTKEEEHSKEEADKHTVVHITKPGTYSISGTLSAGQIAVDLGEEAENDPEAVVTLILDNADITCSVAPAVIFYNVYECSSNDEADASKDVDTSAAGANVIIADGSTNNINGSHVARIYESVVLSDDGTEVVDSEKLHKYDGAFYSKMSMNVNGEEEGTGVLNIQADNEGLGTELHLTINGGNINITSGNDGINTNEDNVSVTTINGGNLNIVVEGSTGEGDGIDSNGWLVINGGTVTTSACATSGDAGIDSDMGIHINGGTVAAGGNMLDAVSESQQNYIVMSFSERVSGEDVITLKNEAGETVGEWSPVNDYTYLIVSMPELAEGTYTIWKNDVQLSGVAMSGNMGGPGMMPGGEMPQMPEGEMPEGEVPARPEGEMPEGETPQMPEGEMPEGERPQMPEDGEAPVKPENEGTLVRPEGSENEIPDTDSTEYLIEEQDQPQWMDLEEMPEGSRQPGGRNPIQAEDASTDFEIKSGGNVFMIIS